MFSRYALPLCVYDVTLKWSFLEVRISNKKKKCLSMKFNIQNIPILMTIFIYFCIWKIKWDFSYHFLVMYSSVFPFVYLSEDVLYFLTQFFSRTTELFSTKPDTKHYWGKRFEVLFKWRTMSIFRRNN